MKLEEYIFSSQEIDLIKQYRDLQKDPRLKQRFLALIMVAEGINLNIVCSVLGVSKTTLQRWFKHYIQKGVDALNSFQYKPKSAYLSESEQAELVQWVKKKPRKP